MKKLKEKTLGYPENQNLYYKELYKLGLFEMCVDNVGDPFVESNYKINSGEFEKEIISFFAEMYNLENYWGYVGSCGTEGNICGIYLGRETYQNGVFYYSKDSHYSIAKASKMLRLEERVIESQENGEMDYEDFEKKVNPNKPAIINANIGTTMKGAIDDLEKIEKILIKKGVKKYYIHCDAALAGMLLPYIDGAQKINFKKNIHSIAISGHKFIGSPIPCGIFLTHKDFVKKIETKIEYLGSLDTTIMGSRSGLAPLFVWDAIQKRGHKGFEMEARTCVENATYLYQKMKEMNYPTWLNSFSNTVYFKKPSEVIIQKWQLASLGEFAHVVTMQHVSRKMLNLFLEDIKKIA